MLETYQGPRENIFRERLIPSREEIEEILATGDNLENLDLHAEEEADYDKRTFFAGREDIDGVSFRGSDVRGLVLYLSESDSGEYPEVRTSIRGTNWRECKMADQSMITDFKFVDATGASFGYFETLRDRFGRYPEGVPIDDSGAIFNFVGHGGNFSRTHWLNVDFGGREVAETGYESEFMGADFTEAVLEGCYLQRIDFTEVEVAGIKIIDPYSMKKMRITEAQVESIFDGIQLTDERYVTELAQLAENVGGKKALEQFFGIEVV